MLYVIETMKAVETAARDLEEAVKRNKFCVLHIHDLQKTLKESGATRAERSAGKSSSG